MEFINKIELRGVVGRADINTFASSRVCNFSVVTEYSSRDREGNSAVESLWFNVSIWDSLDNPQFPLERIAKGCWVNVVGRLRLRRYTTIESEERQSLDVVARHVELLEKDDPFMQPQREY